MDRRRRVLDLVRPNGRVGVEIGPLVRPIVLRSDGDVLYADHLPTEKLRRKYAGHASLGPDGVNAIVDVDLVLHERTLAQALGPAGPVDYVVAAHVIEHIADPIGWLVEVAEALKEKGLLCLVVPDKRFTFDHFRTPSTPGDLVAAHLAGLRSPSPGQVYEHVARTSRIHPLAAWKGRAIKPNHAPGAGPEAALRIARRLAATGDYFDAHCIVFTPCSFVAVLRELMAIGLIPFAFSTVEPTRYGDDEFLVVLRKDEDATPAERARTAPDLDPRRHHELPRRTWRTQLRSLLKPHREA